MERFSQYGSGLAADKYGEWFSQCLAAAKYGVRFSQYGYGLHIRRKWGICSFGLINPLSSEGYFCGQVKQSVQVNQSVRYINSFKELAFLIKTSTYSEIPRCLCDRHVEVKSRFCRNFYLNKHHIGILLQTTLNNSQSTHNLSLEERFEALFLFWFSPTEKK